MAERFHNFSGIRTVLSEDQCTAERKDAVANYDGAIALSEYCLKRGEFFEITLDSIVNEKWTGSLSIGLLKGKLKSLDLKSVDSFTEIPYQQARYWCLSSNQISCNTFEGPHILNDSYKLNLDDLTDRERIGVMVHKDKSLHFYLNGVDQGIAASNIPSGAYVVIDVYAQCYAVSIVPMSERSQPNIQVEVQSDEEEEEEDVDEEELFRDEERLLVGDRFTTSKPRDSLMPERPFDSDTQKMFDSDTYVTIDNIKQHTTPDRVDFTTQMLNQGEESLPNLPSIPKQHNTLQTQFRYPPQPRWSHSEVTSPPAKMRFSRHHGLNVELSRDGMTAQRTDGYNRGIVFSDELLPNKIVFEIQIVDFEDTWDGTLSMGITCVKPEKACRFPSAAAIDEDSRTRQRTFTVYQNCLYIDGREIKSTRVDMSRFKKGDIVGIFCLIDRENGSDNLYMVCNRKQVFLIAKRIPSDRYAVVDMYGKCNKVKLLPLRDAPENFGGQRKSKMKEFKDGRQFGAVSSSVAPRKRKEDVTLQQKPCSYRDACARYLKSLALPGDFFDPTPGYNKCFCLGCHSYRGDMELYSRGNPSQNYSLPLGWCKFALLAPPRARSVNAFRDYHIAFHGTKADSLRKILDSGTLLLPGDIALGGEVVGQGEGHFKEDWKPKDLDLSQIFLSPSIKYAGCAAYSKPTKFCDPDTGTKYDARVAFQVLIRPGSYRIGQETVGAGSKGIKIDEHFSNDEIEWATKEKVATILYGLLVELRLPKESLPLSSNVC